MKVALVTGISSGIGKATASHFSRAGYRTFGTVRTDGVEVAPGVEVVRLDVRDPGAVRAGIDSVLTRAGRIDVLVNNAGGGLLGAFEETSLDEAHDLFETNFFGALRLTREVLPAMRTQRSGRILNVGSVLGFLPAPFMSLYAASKHAIAGWSESLDHEVRRFGIRVVAIEPAFTRTNLGRHTAVAALTLPDYHEDRRRVFNSVERSVQQGMAPDEVASLVVRIAGRRSPRLRYQAGRSAWTLRVLRSAAPAALLDIGIRRSFGLTA